MPRQNRLSLQSIQFDPTPFQAVTFTPQAVDATVLANSLAKQEERELKAAETIAKNNEVFANIRSQLHQDAKTMDKFSKWQNDKLDRLYNLRNLDPDRAIKEGMMLGAEVANDAEIQGMMRNNQELNAETQKLNERKDIDDLTKRRLIKQNEEAFESVPQINDNGEVIGTYKWRPVEGAVADINPLDLATFVSKIVAPEETSTMTQRGGKTVRADGSANEYTTVDGHTIHVLTKDRLHEVYNKVEETFPGYFTALTQAYKNEFFRLEEIDEQLKTATGYNRTALEGEKQSIKRRLFTDDGAGVQRSPEEYRDYQLGVVLDNMAYSNTDTKNVRESGSAAANQGGTGGGANGLNITNYPVGMFNGAFPVRTIGTVNMNYGRVGLSSGNAFYNGVSNSQQLLTLGKNDTFSINGQYYDAKGNPIAKPAVTVKRNNGLTINSGLQ